MTYPVVTFSYTPDLTSDSALSLPIFEAWAVSEEEFGTRMLPGWFDIVLSCDAFTFEVVKGLPVFLHELLRRVGPSEFAPEVSSCFKHCNIYVSAVRQPS